jgi:hypothetical protein
MTRHETIIVVYAFGLGFLTVLALILALNQERWWIPYQVVPLLCLLVAVGVIFFGFFSRSRLR